MTDLQQLGMGIEAWKLEVISYIPMYFAATTAYLLGAIAKNMSYVGWFLGPLLFGLLLLIFG